MVGVFATKAVNGAGNEGLFYGNPEFFFTQLKGLSIVVVYSLAASFVIFKVINLVLPLRVSKDEEEEGLDSTQHNEKYMQGTLLVTTTSTNGMLTQTEVERESEVVF
jgi:ammonium transporter, Amt family